MRRIFFPAKKPFTLTHVVALGGVIFTVAFCDGDALAQAAPSSKPAEAGAGPGNGTSRGQRALDPSDEVEIGGKHIRAGAIVGQKVVGEDNRPIGEVVALLNRGDGADDVLIRLGGDRPRTDGAAERSIAVPFESLRPRRPGGGFILSSDAFERAQESPPDPAGPGSGRPGLGGGPTVR